MNSQISDHELVVNFLNGDQASIENLIRRHKTRVFTYINMYIRERSLVEDIFQETFLKVINSLKSGKYKDNGKFLSWVMRIAHNLIIDHFRREKQANLISNDNYEGDLFNSKNLSDSNIEDDLINDQIVKDVKSLLELLPDDQKEVVILRHYAGLSFREIADQTNVSINTALGRMRYALINMRRLMIEKKISLTLS